jgi:hypothetical protein
MSKEETRIDTLMCFAGTLVSDEPARQPDGIMDALTIILVSLSSHALSGTEHVPDPEHSTMEKCAVAACFLAACSVPLLSWLREEGHELDAATLMHHTGSSVFCAFEDQDQKTIIDSGIALFRELALVAKGNRRLGEWLTSVHDVTERYVLTRGQSDCVELIAPLYLVLLMAARQMKA